MKPLLTALVGFLFGCQTLQPTPTSFEVTESTIQVIGVLDGELANAPLKQLAALPEGSTVYIYIFSLGGDPLITGRFLEAIKGKTTVCFASAAGGPAFTLLQACTFRLVGEQAVMGQSEVLFGGSTGDEEKDRLYKEKVNAEVAKYNEIESDRLGVDSEDYELILKGGGFIWEGAESIVKNKGADAGVDLGCSREASLTTLSRTVYDSEGPVELVMTVCPVMRQLVSPAGLNAGQVGESIGIPLSNDRSI